jgi:high affinity sulfate transporter 1
VVSSAGAAMSKARLLSLRAGRTIAFRRGMHLDRWFPGVADFRRYQASWLTSDLLAGVSVAAIQVPTAIAYAVLAGFSPETGLYASVLPLVAYALLGSSRQLIVGPDSATCAMVAATLLPLAGGDPQRYADYSVVLALLVGGFAVLGGLARAGFIADFLARPILTGFLNGIGLSIIAGQSGKLLGITLQSTDFLGQLWEVVSRLSETHALSAALGVGLIVVLIAVKRFTPRIPGPLAGVVVGGVLVAMFDLDSRGIRVVGEVSSGLPAFGIASVAAADLQALAMGALGIALVSYCSAMLTARSFAARNHYEIDANQDFIAIGVANLTSGLSRGFVVSGADSRTAVNNAAGGKSRLTGVFAAAATAAVVLFFTGPLRYIPNPALAAVLIMAGVGLLDVATLRTLRAVSRFEFRLSLATTLGVLLAGVLPGILIAVALAIVKLLGLTARPGDAILGEVPGLEGHHDVAEHAGATTVPGLVVYRFEAAPLFFNADHFKARIRAAVASATSRPVWFLYSAEAGNMLDFTGAEALEQVRGELAAQGIRFAIARPRGAFKTMLVRTGLADRIGEAYIFPSVRSAVQAYRAQATAAN